MKKKYYNSATHEWYIEGRSMTRRVEDGVFAGIPSEELLTAWGFREWIEPAPTPAQLLEQAKANKIAEIEAYDNSDEINSFDVVFEDSVITTWLTPEKRSDYKNSIDAAELLDITEVSPVLNGVAITIPITFAKLALAQIQIYANRCYNTTELHKANVMALESIEDVESYNFKQGYPEKLRFDPYNP